MSVNNENNSIYVSARSKGLWGSYFPLLTLKIIFILFILLKKILFLNQLRKSPRWSKEWVVLYFVIYGFRKFNGCLWLCHTDLLRFFGLLRYGHRFGAADGVQTACQLQRTLQSQEYYRVLAPLAYFAIIVAERLSVYLCRWQQKRPDTHLYQLVYHYAFGWTVARSGMEVCNMGRHAWYSIGF